MCMFCRSLFVFSGVRVTRSLVFYAMFCRSLFVFSGVRVTRSLDLCVCFVDRCLSFCTFSFGHCVVCSSVFWSLCCLFFCLLVTVLSVLLRHTDSNYPFGIFKLFLTAFQWSHKNDDVSNVLYGFLRVFLFPQKIKVTVTI
jgi:hypothetical protein